MLVKCISIGRLMDLEKINYMKYLIILLLISTQCFGQETRTYAYRYNTDATVDSFYITIPGGDSVRNYSNNAFVSFSVEYYERLNNTITPPSVFSSFIKCADGIYRTFPTNLSSGTYTPTLNNTTNVAASSANQCAWVRIGSVVYVTGTISVDATLAASTLTELGLSIPIATDIIGAAQLSGTAASDNVASLSARIKGDAANNRATISFRASSLTNDTYSFTFSYVIQ